MQFSSQLCNNLNNLIGKGGLLLSTRHYVVIARDNSRTDKNKKFYKASSFFNTLNKM